MLNQYDNFEKTGQFRFTPPTHTLLAFNKALNDYENAGGLKQRILKYKNNYNLKNNMIKLGFKLYLEEKKTRIFYNSFFVSFIIIFHLKISIII